MTIAMYVSTGLMLPFAILAAHRLAWCWAVAALSLIIGAAPHIFIMGFSPILGAIGLFPLTLPTLLVPVLGWWKWRRNGRGRESGSIPVQRADRRSYIIGATILVGAGLTVALPMAIQGALSPVPSMQLPLVLISFLTAGLQLVTLLGFAFGVLESWWLLLANSALYLANFALNIGSTIAGVPQLGSGPPVIMLILHGAIIFFAIKGYRTWRTALASQRAPAPYNGLL